MMNTQNRIKTVLTLALAAIAILGLTANADLVDGLVEYWALDGDYSAEVDTSHVGTLQAKGTGSTESGFVSGKFGFGIDLESSNDDNQASIVIGGDENDFDFAGGSMSVALWYTTESLYRSWQALAAKGEGGNWRLHRNSNSNYGSTTTDINFIAGGVGATGDGELDQQDGSWHHVVATLDATGGPKLYIDGSLVASDAGPVTIGSNSAAMQIGGNPGAGNRGWDGILDDVGVWNRALTAPEVSLIWNGGAGASIGILTGLSDPNAPDVDAGVDWISWSGNPVDPIAVITEKEPEEWTNLTYLWTAVAPAGVTVEFDPVSADVIDPTITITKDPGDAATVTLTLAVSGEGKPEPVKGIMTIDVYDDACLAKIAAGQEALDPGDITGDCITNIEDIAVMALTWFGEYALTVPVPK